MNLQELKVKAENGDVQAQYRLGGMYFHGQGVKQDDQEALKWYLKVAEQGYDHARVRCDWLRLSMSRKSSKTA